LPLREGHQVCRKTPSEAPTPAKIVARSGVFFFLFILNTQRKRHVCSALTTSWMFSGKGELFFNQPLVNFFAYFHDRAFSG
ncbi:hypothetical protein ACFLQ0_06440, partial [Nitrospinota bacterium]